MNLPDALRQAVERQAEGYKISALREISAELSRAYNSKADGANRLVTTPKQAVAYAIARMPATYAAVKSALMLTLELTGDIPIKTVLDVGAGSGAASFSACELLKPDIIDCIERETSMANLGKVLLDECLGGVTVNWIDSDILSFKTSKKYDAVIASYSLNELKEADRADALLKLWSVTDKLLVIVDTGTPKAHAMQKTLRNILKSAGANAIAPCPINSECRLPEDDWCHFTVRVERTALHKYIKNAQSPFEDEKFTFTAFYKGLPIKNCAERIIRRPIIAPKKIELTTCSSKGVNKRIILKSDGEIYKTARKCKVGGSIDLINR